MLATFLLLIFVWVLAMLPKEVADDNGDSHVDHQDLSHSPEVNFGSDSHAVVALGHEVADLHKDQHSHVHEHIAEDSVLGAHLAFEVAQVQETDEHVCGVKGQHDVQAHYQVAAVHGLAVNDEVSAHQESR